MLTSDSRPLHLYSIAAMLLTKRSLSGLIRGRTNPLKCRTLLGSDPVEEGEAAPSNLKVR